MQISNLNKISSKRPFLSISLSGVRFKALIDTGACVSAISEELFMKIPNKSEFKQIITADDQHFSAVNGDPITVVGQYIIPIVVMKREIFHTFYVIRNLSSRILLGADFVEDVGMIIQGRTRKLIIGDEIVENDYSKPNATNVNEMDDLHNEEKEYGCPQKRVEIPGHTLCKINVMASIKRKAEYLITNNTNINPNLHLFNTLTRDCGDGKLQVIVGNSGVEPIIIDKDHKLVEMHKIDGEFQIPEDECKKKQIYINEIKERSNKALMGSERAEFLKKLRLKCPHKYKSEYENLCLKYHDVFSKTEFDLGWTDKVSHRIKLKHDKPIHTKQFKIPLPHQETINKFVADMMDRKLIEISRSRYNSPIFCVKKKNGEWRPVVDLRAINQATVDDFYSIRDIKACIDEIGRERSQIFSTMDLTKGFFQQNLDKESRPYTAFTVPGLGSFQFTVSCFGSHGAPSSFSYLMTEVLRNLKHILSYIDDILAHTKTHEEHLIALENCFKRLREYNLKLSMDKSEFGSSETEYLGFRLTPDGIMPGSDKLKAVKDFPPPKTVRQIRQFVGLASFFRDHIPNFSRISGHLTALTRKDTDWKGGALPPSALNAFLRLKNSLTRAPIIAFARNDLPFRVYCDASAGSTDKNGNKIHGGLGAVLTQIWEDNKERVIGYASRRLHGHEENYSAFLLELLAMTFATKHFHHYLYGQKRFIIFSDHKPLLKLNKVHQKTKHRLEEHLTDYTFDVVYRKGEDQEAADFLSRNAIDILDNNNAKTPPSTLEGENLTEMLSDQKQDEQCDRLRSEVKNNVEKNCMIDHNDLIWHGDANFARLVLPKIYRYKTIEMAHSSKIGGHRDLLKTMDKIMKAFWWPTMRFDVENFIKQCDTCQRFKGPKMHKTLKYPLKPLEISKRFNERVHADLMGPLLSVTSNKYILVMSDSFSKWIELIPIQDKNANTIVKAITNNWICRNSKMDILVTDNGKEFKNSLINDMCKEWNIQHNFTSPYHAQSNAQCERQNRTIISYLKAFLDEKNTLHWEELLPHCQLSYNAQVHQSTRYSPYFLRHMMDPSIPFKSLHDRPHSYDESWVNESMMRMQDAWKSAYNNLLLAKASQKHQYDKNATLRKFRVGNLVLLQNLIGKRNRNNKFAKTWEGPFVITECPNDTNVVLRRNPQSKTFITHVNRIKHYRRQVDDANDFGYLNNDNKPVPSHMTTNTRNNNLSKEGLSSENMDTDNDDDKEEVFLEGGPEIIPANVGHKGQKIVDDNSDPIPDETSEHNMDNEHENSRITRSMGTVPDVDLPDRAREYKTYTYKSS